MTTTDTEIEPGYAFESRVRPRLEEAKRAAIDAAAAEEAASAEVTRLRGDFKIGIAPRGPWDAASKRLSKLQNARADADAALAAVERDVQRERDARQAAEIDAERAERRELVTLRSSSLVRARECFGLIQDALDEINDLPAIAPLTTYAGDYGRLRDALNRLASRY